MGSVLLRRATSRFSGRAKFGVYGLIVACMPALTSVVHAETISLSGNELQANASSGFTINIVFGGGLTSSQQAIFSQAKATWESYIVGYKTGISITGLTINASGAAIDGSGNVLGYSSVSSTVIQGGYRLATSGSMVFDTADLPGMESGGSLYDVILHEMAHVMGFGTLWTNNSVYTNNSGKYTGAAALAAYKTEFNKPTATWVPVELEGGSGTANGHWNENYGGSGNTGIVDSQGRDMRYELMTGWLNMPTFISQTTIQSFADIGFKVVPEPGTLVLLFAAVGVLLIRRRLRA